MKRLSQEEFLQRANSVWSNRWDYRSTSYEKMSEKVSVLCRTHGEFLQFPQAHLKGLVGCALCNGQSPITKEVFIQRLKDLGKEKEFRYEELSLTKGGIHQKVRLICASHDEVFESSGWSILNGRTGCSKCNRFSRMTKEKFFSKLSEEMSEKYDYSKVRFSGVLEKVEIICREHGSFFQSIDGHLSGKEGCSQCQKRPGFSQTEDDLAVFVRGLGVSVIQRDRTVLGGKEIDIYLPELRVGIEFNGDYWHGDGFLSSKKNTTSHDLHTNKRRLAEKAGVLLLFVWENDWKGARTEIERAIRLVFSGGVVDPILKKAAND